MSTLIVITKDNFETEVLQSDKPVLLDFWGPKCEPCLALMPDVEALEQKYGEKVKFCKINTSEERRLAISQKVLGLPTIVFYKDGEKVDQLTKDVTAMDIEEKIKNYL